jgi:lipopolysaccharide transport system ATP-binding protein
MSEVVIRAEGLGKKYIIGHQAERERYTTLRDSVGRSLRNWGRSARDMFAGKALVSGDETEEFWALRDINFEIKRGDVVGIIGRNGAGKSTLLKVLSRITEPTTGRVTIEGRVASLLEVGTGFHPELSGRENIYLNGAILGMSREEIRRKFDEIVDFAGVEKFLDTPVKRYSSGMYVRLAFAVAAHLEPEILVVDEVLAVGDAEFQKKCLGKMQDVAGHGRTVLFVSHNMAAVRRLCSLAILVAGGRLENVGPTGAVIARYVAGHSEMGDSADLSNAKHTGSGELVIETIALSGASGPSTVFYVFEQIEIKLTLAPVPQARINAGCWILIRNASGDDVSMIMQRDAALNGQLAGGDTSICTFSVNLAPGQYSLAVGLLGQLGEIIDWVDDAITFDVAATFINGSPFDGRLGLTTTRANWTSVREVSA